MAKKKLIKIYNIYKDTVTKSILAGAYISLAGLAYLYIGGVLGAVLFAFGLLGVIQSKSLLYTGRIYFEKELSILALVLIGNIIGCALIGGLCWIAYPQLHDVAQGIIAKRIDDSLVSCVIKGAFCGVVMTTAVISAKVHNWWPLLLGIPFFILSGFYHSIADAYYFMIAPDIKYLLPWVFIVFGNWLGGKLFFLKKP